MKSKLTKDTRRKIGFALLLIYVFAFLFWWTFLLLRQSNQHVSDIIRYETLQKQMEENDPDATLSVQQKEAIQKDFKRNRTMIITEGLVFFGLLLLGMLYIRSSWLKEIRLNRQQNNFILSITHELKSPLSTIKLVSQTLFHRALPEPQKKELLNRSLEETERLHNLVENILAAAKLEDGKYGINRSDIDLRELLKEVGNRYERLNPNVNYRDGDSVTIYADKNALELVFINLIDNALKYAPGKEVTLDYEVKPRWVHIRVADKGPGISQEEAQHIFKKFYRSGDENTREANGTGLGLYIVKKIVEHHGGRVSLIEVEQPGATFLVSLPRS